MPLSWNEIRSRAVAFSKEWAGETREHAEAKTFWDQFFNVFGISRKLVASFEEPVRTLKGTYGFIDLFWKGMLIRFPCRQTCRKRMLNLIGPSIAATAHSPSSASEIASSSCLISINN